MSGSVPPQPSPARLTHFGDHPLVVGVTLGQPPLVLLTAASMALATGGTLYAAYVDTSRYTHEEFADGSVHHEPVDPDFIDDGWRHLETQLREQIGQSLAECTVAWQFRYLAGRVDRALTHLARAVDASAFVVGTHLGRHHRMVDFLGNDIGIQLAHRQHRPVLTVPLRVVDWRDCAPWE